MWSRSWTILSSKNIKVANTIRRWISHERTISLKKLACKRDESERMERQDCYCLTSFCLLTAIFDNTTPDFCRRELSLSFYLLICWPIGYQPLRDAWPHQFSMRKNSPSLFLAIDTRTYKKKRKIIHEYNGKFSSWKWGDLLFFWEQQQMKIICNPSCFRSICVWEPMTIFE